MPKGSPERTNARREEIVEACERLYRTTGFKEISLKDISGITRFTRTSIYHYFQTKEEIFLALLQREYERWSADLDAMRAQHPALSAAAFAEQLACTLEKRALLLKLLSVNHYDMEASSRPERLAACKAAYGAALRAVSHCLAQYFPAMTEAQRRDFLYSFFPFLFGVYPYAFVTEKQRAAMAQAGVEHASLSIHELVCHCVRQLLKPWEGNAE